MDTLNDYCHVNILKYLSPKDQLALLEASNNCISNVQYVWRQQRRFYLDAGDFRCFDEKPELLDDFLLCISPKAQHLDLKSVTIDNLKSWTRYKFPEMRSLEYTMDESYGRDHGEEFIILMAELFPCLYNIKPYGDFDFSLLTNWLDLRRLDLNGVTYFSYSYRCAEIYKLNMLEELLLPSNAIYSDHRNIIKRMPNLRTVTVHTDNYQYDTFLFFERAKDIEKICAHDSIWTIERRMDKDLINLRQLSIVNDENLNDEDLLLYATGFEKLERIDIFNFQLLNFEVYLWKTVDSNPSLKILNLSNSKISAAFFDISREPMNSVLDKRTIPLTIYCYNTGDCEHLIRLYFKHPNLMISFELLTIDHINERFFELEQCLQINFLPR